ncbi:MAG: GNAT family N-acetyltransferase, partial [Kutzneria sp.]|nr:GNAT family N-acetyltransferase [Kutzneria sp.]
WVTLPDPDAVFVAEDDNGRIGAYCGVGGAGDPEDRHADMRTGELVALYVDPALLGTEAGAVAHGAGVEHLAMSGFRYAMLWALRDDTVSRAFYASHGWRQDGTVGCHDLNRQRLNTVRYGRFLPAPFRRHRRLPGTFGPAGSPHPSMM